MSKKIWFFMILGIVIVGAVGAILLMGGPERTLSILSRDQDLFGYNSSASGSASANYLTKAYTDERWQLIKATGAEGNLSLWVGDKNKKKTEYGFLIREGMVYDVSDKRLYDDNGNEFLDSDGDKVKIKWKNNGCGGQGCFHISEKESEVMGIIDNFKMGENSAEAAYIKGSVVNYTTSWGAQIIQDFACEGIDPKDVIVSWNGNKGKSEAEFNFDGLRGCSITMNSTDVMNQHDDWVSLDDPNNRGVHKIRFKKVCDRTFEPKNVSFIDSRTGLEMWKLVNQTNANCVFDYSEDKKNLIVSFTSDKYVDPEFVVADCDSGDLTTTCYLNHTWVGDNGDVINANNLVIQSNGSIASDQAIGITINLTGDFTIESGGNVSLSGANAATAPKAGGDLIVVADLVNITSGGGIYSNGGRCTSTCNAGASAGEINISSDSLDIEGDLELNGGAGVGCCGRDGGLGGTLILNVVNDFDFKGTVEGFSGTASDTKASGILIVDDDSLNMNVSGTIDLSPGWAAAGNNDPGTWGVSSVLLNKLNVLSSGSMQVAGLVNATNLDVHGIFGAEGHDGNDVNTVTVSGGDLEIIADVLNLTGTIVACAGDSTANSRIGVNGHGGNLDITATTAYMTGDITTRGGNAVGCCGRDGGDGGDIDISITNDYTVVGDIISDGGNGDDSGDGGDIFINNKDTNLTIEGSVTASVGTGWGVTFGGKINISADNLSVTGTLTTTANTVGEIALIYDSGLDLSAATVDQDPFITRNTTNAKVRFFSAIANPTTIDYLDGIVIDSENISVDSVAYSDLNVSAELWFYDIVATTPSPLRNGEACPEAICTEIELDGTTYKYNVTYFTNYSVGGAVNNPPVSTLTFPDDAATITTNWTYFNGTCTDDTLLANTTLYVWNSTGEVNISTEDIIGTDTDTGINVTLPREDDYEWNYFCCDDLEQCAFASTNYTVTFSGAEAIYPQFSNQLTEPANNSEYSPTLEHEFNITIEDTNGTAHIQLDGTNYSLSNISDEYYIGIQNLGVGDYIYNYSAWGSGTDELFNMSEEYDYTIRKNVSGCGVYWNETSPLSYGEEVQVATNCTSENTILINGEAVANESMHLLDAGLWNATVYRTDNANYTNTENESLLTITKGTPAGTLTGTSPITYPTAGDVEGTEANPGDEDVVYKLYRDTVEVSNPDITVLGVGTYDYIYNTTGGENYSASASLDTFELTVNQNQDDCEVEFNETSPVTFPSEFKVFTNCTTDFTLMRNGTIISNNSVQSLAAETYNFSVQRTDKVNYSNEYNESFFTVSKATPPSISITNPEQTENVSGILNVTWIISDSQPTDTHRTNITITNSTHDIGLIDNIDDDITNYEFDTTIYADGDYNLTLITTENNTLDNFSSNDTIEITIHNAAPKIYASQTPSNNTEYNALTVYIFNATVNNTITMDEVNASFDGDVMDIVDLGDDDYSFNRTSVAAGIYEVCWAGNNTAGVSNTSCYDYYVALNTTPECALTATSPVTYPDPLSAEGACQSTESVPILRRNGTVVSNPYIEIIAATDYNMSLYYSESENYTSQVVEENVVVDRGDPGLAIASSQGFSITVGVNTTITGSPTSLSGGEGLVFSMFLGGVGITNPYEYNSTVATSVTFKYNVTQGQNWTTDSTSKTLTIRSADTTTEDCKYKKFGYYNLKLPWFREKDCLE